MAPPPHTNIGAISGNYEGIFINFTVIGLLTIVISIGLEICLNMLPPLGATPPQHFNNGDISGNYELLSTQFLVISLLTTKQILSEFFCYLLPALGATPPTKL